LRYDSGLISAASHLGINRFNTPPKQDVSFQKATTCAPFSLDKYGSDWQYWRDGPQNGPAGVYQSSMWKYYNIYQNNALSIKYYNDSAYWSSTGYRLVGIFRPQGRYASYGLSRECHEVILSCVTAAGYAFRECTTIAAQPSSSTQQIQATITPGKAQRLFS